MPVGPRRQPPRAPHAALGCRPPHEPQAATGCRPTARPWYAQPPGCSMRRPGRMARTHCRDRACSRRRWHGRRLAQGVPPPSPRGRPGDHAHRQRPLLHGPQSEHWLRRGAGPPWTPRHRATSPQGNRMTCLMQRVRFARLAQASPAKPNRTHGLVGRGLGTASAVSPTLAR